ncbi:unnamed protein product [Closterium sp. NIES-54]
MSPDWLGFALRKLVEPLEISSDSSGPVEGGDLAADDTAATRRSPRLETTPGFPPQSSSPPLQPVAVDTGAAGGGDTGGEDAGGAGPGGAETGGTGSRGAETGGAASPSGGGAVGAPAAGPGVGQLQPPRRLETPSPQQVCEWVVWQGRSSAGAWSYLDAGAAGAGVTAGGAASAGAGGAGGTTGGCARAGVAGAAGAGGAVGARGPGGGGTRGLGGAGAAGPGGARTRGAGAAGGGAAGAGGTGACGTGGPGAAGAVGLGTARTRGAGAAGTGGAAGAGGTGAGGTGGTGGAGAGGFGGTGGAGAAGPRGALTRGAGAAGAGVAAGAGGAGGATGGTGGTGDAGAADGTDQSQPQLLHSSPLPAPAPHTEVTQSLTERREPETRASTPVRAHCIAPPRHPAVPSTHVMALRPSSVPQSVPLPSPPVSSLPDDPNPVSDLARAASPTATRLLTTVITSPDFESTATFSLVTDLVDFAARHRLDYVASLVTDSDWVCPPSLGGESALGSDVLEDRQFELDCLAIALPRFASMLLCPEGDPDALDVPTPHSYNEAIAGEYSSQW